jgi:basic amino acid/polyamine antiporter, APA family
MPDAPITNEGLKRKINAWGLSANLVNIIVGAGIFVLPAIVAEGLGPASILAYLLCGVLLFLIMLCFAEAGSKVTSSGGAYAYIEAAFGKYPGFITSVLFLLSCITADAAVANALIGVIGTMHPLFQNPVYKLLFFVLIFGGLALVNIIGVKQGIGLVKILTVVKLLPLILLVSVGWKEVEWTHFIWTDTPDVHSLGQMALLLFFAFQGAESGLAVSGEVNHPHKNVPKGIFIGLSAVLVLYVLIQYVSLGVLGDSLMDYKEAPLAEVAHQVFGRWGLIIMTAVAAFSMFGNLSGEVLSMPRVLFGAAHDRVIPVKILARVHLRFCYTLYGHHRLRLAGTGIGCFWGFSAIGRYFRSICFIGLSGCGSGGASLTKNPFVDG